MVTLKRKNETNLDCELKLVETAYSKKMIFKKRKNENNANKIREIHLLKPFKFNLDIRFLSI